MTLFKGVHTAITTPFKNGEINIHDFRNHLAVQLSAGIDGIVVLGTTGEAATLNEKEQLELVDNSIDAVGSSMQITVGIGSNITSAVCQKAKDFYREGIDAYLVVAPYYNKPSQQGLKEHFLAIAEASPVPIIVYNVPGRTAVDILPETIISLGEHPNICGIKDATGKMSVITKLSDTLKGKISLLSGDDLSFLPFLSLGGDGCISVLSNFAGESLKKIYNFAQQGNYLEARKIHNQLFPVMEALFWEGNPIPLKYILSELGLIQNELRLPLVPLSSGHREAISSLIEAKKELFDFS